MIFLEKASYTTSAHGTGAKVHITKDLTPSVHAIFAISVNIVGFKT